MNSSDRVATFLLVMMAVLFGLAVWNGLTH